MRVGRLPINHLQKQGGEANLASPPLFTGEG